MEEGKIPTEAQIFLLKQKLIEAGICNKSLQCIISSLEWQLYKDQMKLKQNASYTEMLETANKQLDNILNDTYNSHSQLQKKLNKMEFNIMNFSVVAPPSENPSLLKPPMKGKIIRTFSARHLNASSSFRNAIRDSNKERDSKFSPSCHPEIIISPSKDIVDVPGPDTPCYVIRNDMSTVNHVKDAPSGEKIKNLQAELSFQNARADQFYMSYMNSKESINFLKSVLKESESSSQHALQREVANWMDVTASLKDNYEKELQKKQQQLTKMHDILSGWIFKYLELEKQKNVPPSTEAARVRHILSDASLSVSSKTQQLYGVSNK